MTGHAHHWSWRKLRDQYHGTMLWLQICSIVLLIAIVIEVYR